MRLWIEVVEMETTYFVQSFFCLSKTFPASECLTGIEQTGCKRIRVASDDESKLRRGAKDRSFFVAGAERDLRSLPACRCGEASAPSRPKPSTSS